MTRTMSQLRTSSCAPPDQQWRSSSLHITKPRVQYRHFCKRQGSFQKLTAYRPMNAAHNPRASRHATHALIDEDNASILVCGGGGAALLAAKKLRDMGAWVWMLQRSQNRQADIEGMGAILVVGDAMDPTSLDKAFASIEEVDAVISTVGGTSANPKVDGEGNINLINAAIKKGVKKFILVTSIGVGDSKDAPPKQVYQVLEPVLREKVRAEDHLKIEGRSGWGMQSMAEKLAYTIIRPGGLKSEPPTGSGVLTEDVSVCGAINRSDLAGLISKALFSDQTNNKVLSAVDTTQLFGEPSLEVFKM